MRQNMYVICVMMAKVGKYGFLCVILKPLRRYNNKTDEIDNGVVHGLY